MFYTIKKLIKCFPDINWEINCNYKISQGIDGMDIEVNPEITEKKTSYNKD